MRRMISVLLLVSAAVLFPIGVAADWAHVTVYDSSTFADRATSLLDSPAVRQQLAARLTEQLAIAGYPEAVNFRPGLQLVIETAVDTDTFRSIFRASLRRAHAAVLAGGSGGPGLDLGDSATLLTSTAALSNRSPAPAAPSGELDDSLSNTTRRLANWGVWDLDSTVSTIATGCLLAAAAAAAAAVVLARDRRRAVRRVGAVLIIDGAVIFGVLIGGQWYAQHLVKDQQLRQAIGDAVWHGTTDLRIISLWIAAYGLIVAAAASTSRRWTPRVVASAVQGWAQRRRATTGGTVLLGLLVLLAGVVLVQNPKGNLELLAVLAGLWLSYLGLTELLRVLQTVASRGSRLGLRRVVLVGSAVVAMLAVVTVALTVSTKRAAARADASGQLRCNGAASLCDLRLDEVMFPGTHNSMSSSLYPGWLFGEQIQTIKGQLDSGIRALLIDTHYGVPSTLRLPGSESPLVLTDRAAELQTPSQETADPAAAERAARLAARAPRAAKATRGIYLCHNYCELGAVAFSSVLADLKGFVDTHPDDVVITIIQDATTPTDTAAAIEAAGLGERVATLQQGQPLPTLGSLVTSGHNLVVFAEQGGAGSPPWYQPAYNWFQETPFAFKTASGFTCRPNRGTSGNPLMLVNHWVTDSPPDPAVAGAVNTSKALEQRIQTCIAQRGVLPNIVAVDFSERGNLVSTLRAINLAKVREVRKADHPKTPPGQEAGPPPVATPAPEITVGPLPAVPPGTTITSLTGGNPAQFCVILPTAAREVVAWAETVLGDAPGDAGVTDLAYGPVLARDLGIYVDNAPIEVAERARPLLGVAQAAVTTLKNLGFRDDMIGSLADQAAAALTAPGNPDGITARAALVARLSEAISPSRLAAAGVVFAAGQPDPATVLDLGFVPSTLTQGSAFSSCPAVLASL